MPVQGLKVPILPLDLPCSGPVTHSREILTTGKSHGKKPDRFSLKDDMDVEILEQWAGYFKTQFEKEYSEKEESDEEASLTAEPLVKEPSQEELEKAICNLKINKAPEEDNIIAELIKNASQEIKKRLHALIYKIWRDEKMPDDWKMGLILSLLKKGDKVKCENCRGITLLNVTYKILSSIIMEQLKEYSEVILGEYQCGFRQQRRTMDQLLQ